MNICVYGASSAELDPIYYEKTEELGRKMGKKEAMDLCLAAKATE